MALASTPMNSLLPRTNKQLRVFKRCLQEMFSSGSIVPLTLENWRELQFPEALRRRIKVALSGGEALLSERCLAAMDRLSDVLTEGGCDDLWTRSDVNEAVREVYETCLQSGLQPENEQEFVDLVTSKITSKVRDHTFVAALRGVELDGADDLSLGRLRIVASLKRLILDSGVQDELGLDGANIQPLLQLPCLVGCTKGTFEAAKEWYREQAQFAVGMLAVEAGASHEGGATSFNIDLLFERSGDSTGSVYLFWDDVNRYLGRRITFRRGQSLELTAGKIVELAQIGAFNHAFTILQKKGRTELEDAIARAVYWYGDAHRDPVQVMQFVKYWSCLECLLGAAGTELTETLSIGAITVLTYGHFPLLQTADFARNVKAVKKLYATRSKAVHRASHSHVTFQDISTISLWAAWVIYNAISFSNAGMESTRTLWESVKRVADQSP